jgi:hypothetical protein
MSDELFVLNLFLLSSQPGILSSGFGTFAGALAEHVDFAS